MQWVSHSPCGCKGQNAHWEQHICKSSHPCSLFGVCRLFLAITLSCFVFIAACLKTFADTKSEKHIKHNLFVPHCMSSVWLSVFVYLCVYCRVQRESLMLLSWISESVKNSFFFFFFIKNRGMDFRTLCVFLNKIKKIRLCSLEHLCFVVLPDKMPTVKGERKNVHQSSHLSCVDLPFYRHNQI